MLKKSGDRVVTGLRGPFSAARSEDAFRACFHYVMLEQAAKSGLGETLRGLGRRHVTRDLVEMTKRALPEAPEVSALLSEKGWHLSLSNLGFPLLEGQWVHRPSREEGARLKLETLRELLVEKPDPELVTSCLQDKRSESGNRSLS